MSTNPGVYLDTNILSALHYNGGSLQGIHRQIVTHNWWRGERAHFKLFTSVVTERELRNGKFPGQNAAIAEACRISYLCINNEVYERARSYIDSGLIPENKEADALQLAIATVYRVDYLLTWNYAHLANADVQSRLLELNARLKYRTPWLVSPESIPNVAMGESTRRRD